MLRLISEVDPRRFTRLTGNISFIVNMACRQPFRFHLADKALDVDITEWPFEDHPLWSIRRHASTLIYAATCWRFWNRMIPLTRETSMQIVRASLIEARRFASRFRDDSFDWDDYFNERLLDVRDTRGPFGCSGPGSFLHGPVRVPRRGGASG
jgi:hypothetical protein